MRIFFYSLSCFLVASLILHSQEKNRELNVKSRELMQRVQAKLVALSKTTPLLQGIEAAAIDSPKPDEMDLVVYQRLALRKNVHEKEILPSPPLQVSAPPEADKNGKAPVGYFTQELVVLDHSPGGSLPSLIPAVLLYGWRF